MGVAGPWRHPGAATRMEATRGTEGVRGHGLVSLVAAATTDASRSSWCARLKGARVRMACGAASGTAAGVCCCCRSRCRPPRWPAGLTGSSRSSLASRSWSSCAPKLAARLVPYGVLGLAVFGVILARMYHDGFANRVLYVLVLAGWGTWGTPPVLAEAAFLFLRPVAAGAPRRAGRRSGPGAGRPVARPRPRRDRTRPGPAADPGHRTDAAAARSGQLVRRARSTGSTRPSSTWPCSRACSC